MNKPKIVIVTGLPCTGKSTIAEGLARDLGWPVFSVDPIESAIIRSGITRSFETGLAAYLVVETLAGEQLKAGISVIIDSVSPVIQSRQMWNDLSSKYDAESIVIECILDPEVHRRRVKARVRNMPGMPEVTWEYVEYWRKEYLPWRDERLVLDTNASTEDNNNKALSYVRRRCGLK